MNILAARGLRLRLGGRAILQGVDLEAQPGVVTATLEPTATATPTARIRRVRRRSTPSDRAPASPRVSASRARPSDSSSAQPISTPGAASRTSSTLRSAREPISQLTISFTDQGLGARLSASATPAPATVWTITPARMKVMIDEAAPASASSTTTPTAAPAIAATGSVQGASPATPKYSVITAPKAAIAETPSTPGSARALRV